MKHIESLDWTKTVAHAASKRDIWNELDEATKIFFAALCRYIDNAFKDVNEEQKREKILKELKWKRLLEAVKEISDATGSK